MCFIISNVQEWKSLFGNENKFSLWKLMWIALNNLYYAVIRKVRVLAVKLVNVYLSNKFHFHMPLRIVSNKVKEYSCKLFNFIEIRYLYLCLYTNLGTFENLLFKTYILRRKRDSWNSSINKLACESVNNCNMCSFHPSLIPIHLHDGNSIIWSH